MTPEGRWQPEGGSEPAAASRSGKGGARSEEQRTAASGRGRWRRLGVAEATVGEGRRAQSLGLVGGRTSENSSARVSRNATAHPLAARRRPRQSPAPAPVPSSPPRPPSTPAPPPQTRPAAAVPAHRSRLEPHRATDQAAGPTVATNRTQPRPPFPPARRAHSACDKELDRRPARRCGRPLPAAAPLQPSRAAHPPPLCRGQDPTAAAGGPDRQPRTGTPKGKPPVYISRPH